MSDSAAGARAGAVDESGFERVASLAELEPGVPMSVESASLGTICVGIVGEEVVAFIVQKAPLETTDLDSLCLDNIARFKRPREYRFVESLPKNNYGKILKTELRKQL